MTRAEAKQINLKRYETGIPCKNGHIAPRQTSNGSCIACIRINKPRHDKAYRARNIEALRAYDKERYRKNPKRTYSSEEQRKAAKRRHYERHKEEILNKQTVYRKIRQDKLKEYFKNYRQNNRSMIVADRAKRRIAQNRRVPKWMDEEHLFLIKEAYNLAQVRNQVFGFEWHVDHIIPLQGKLVSGLHVIDNLQVIPANQNLKKSNQYRVG